MEPATDNRSLASLFTDLTRDLSALIRQEVALAKTELRETGSMLARDAAKIGIAVGLALIGALAATAFVIIALGELLGSYWASALLVAVVLLGVAAVVAKSAMNDIRNRGVKPEATLETLREDATWAKNEAQALRRDLTAHKA